MRKGCENMEEHKEREVDTSHTEDRDLGKIGGGRIPKGSSPQQPDGGTQGSRNPGQKNAETGDRDHPRGRQEDNDTTIDPMTSRAPNKVNEQL